MYKLFFRSLTVVVFVLSMLNKAQAQIVSGEYFFDTDPGVSQAIPFSIPEEQYLDGEFTFDTDGLEVGRHLLGVRVKEDGAWSFTQTAEFFIEPTTIDESNRGFIKGEYFIDSDPGVGNATVFSVTAAASVDQELDIDLPELSEGRHILGIRYQNTEGVWGHVETVEFRVEPETGLTSGYLTQWNYEISQGGNMVKNGVIEIPDQPGAADAELEMDLSGLTEGEYKLELFVKAEGGIRSFSETTTFFIIDGNAPTAIALSSTSVDEKEVIGTVVGDFSTTDPDEGESHSYELVAGSGDTDNASFEISGDQLLTKAEFDFDVKSSYSVRVRSTDLGELTVEEVFEITINDVKDPQTITFSSIGVSTYGDTEALSATASSGLAVAYQSSNTAVATIVNNELTLVGVGEVTITAIQPGDDSFEATEQTQDISVGKAPLLITAEDKSKVYGEANPDFTLAFQGFVLGEMVDDITSPTVSTTAVQASSVGAYELVPTGGSADNYDFTLQSGTLTITKASLSITADDKARIYGDENPALTAAYAGFVLDDTFEDLTEEPTLSTTATIASDAGEYAITVSGGLSDNYDLNLNNGTLSITKADLTATANNQQRNKGEANPSFTIAYTGFKNNDTADDLDTAPTAATTATPTSDRGTYDITLSGGSDNNYSFTLVNGTLRVTGPVFGLPSGLIFEDTDIGETREISVPIENTGDGELVISNIQSPTGFSTDPTSLTIAAGAIGTFVVRFEPTEGRAYFETITLTTNDGEVQIDVSGTGLLVTSLDDDILDEEEVQLYPNPASKKFTLDLSLSKVYKYDLMLTDLNGKVKWESRDMTQRRLEIGVADFKPGLYLLRVNSEQGQVVKKVFVID